MYTNQSNSSYIFIDLKRKSLLIKFYNSFWKNKTWLTGSLMDLFPKLLKIYYKIFQYWFKDTIANDYLDI